MLTSVSKLLKDILNSPNGVTRRPVVNENNESNIEGLYIAGDLTGAPVLKLAMEQGNRVALHIAAKSDARLAREDEWDLIVIGAGAAGLNAALAAQHRGLKVVVLEKGRLADTLEDFPEGKWIYAEPESVAPKGRLWLDGAAKEDLVARWRDEVESSGLDVRTGEGVTGLGKRKDGWFEASTAKGSYRGRRVVLAIGLRGNPSRLGVPGEDLEHVYHRLYSPQHVHGEDILIVGGGNSAVEAALTLAPRNRVTISHRGTAFSRLFKDNRRLLHAAVAAGTVRLMLKSRVRRFGPGFVEFESGERVPYRHSFVLIGAEAPTAFLRSLGVRLENDWTGNPFAALAGVLATFLGLWILGGKPDLGAFAGQSLWGGLLALASFGALCWTAYKGNRFAFLGASFVVAYSIYAVKGGDNVEYWPYHGWGHKAVSFFDRPWSFWYTVVYTAAMTVFGARAMKRWGFDKKDKFQIWRYVSLIGFQWVFFFLIPEFLFRWAVEYQWVGEKLAADPNFARNAWRSYGIIYAWPLFFYTFFGAPHQVWLVWGALLSFVLIPVLVLFHGKRYCSWICGCGGLAETVGDRWRHLAPKGRASVRWEFMNTIVLWFAVIVTVLMVGKDAVAVFRKPAEIGLAYYHLFADVWLVGIIPVALYPFFGGKVWCRYWCPLAKMMQIFSAVFTRFRLSRFAIHSNDKCIACGECSRNCQVGIDVMDFAMKRNELNNFNTSCIGCGICIAVCPMDVLSFTRQDAGQRLINIQPAA